MATVHLLGTGAALSDATRTTTMLAVEGPSSLVLIDCGGDAAQRLLAHGLDLKKLTALIVSHEHADHACGFPLLMERLWLAGIGESFDVHGIAPAIDQARRLHDVFDTSAWPRYPERRYHVFPEAEGALVLETADFVVTATPGNHAVPVAGFRFEDKSSGRVFVYSCDTERSDAITRLASGADLLAHEASGKFPGHSSPSDAAAAAATAGAKRMVMVHLPPLADPDAYLAEAKAVFSASELGYDGQQLEF